MFGNINVAAACGSIKAVTYFLQQNSRSVHHRDRSADGCTPLFHAAWGGNIKLAKLLIETGANVNETDVQMKHRSMVRQAGEKFGWFAFY
jgi:ankyrin repeat protein